MASLFVLTAARAARALILRRGPSQLLLYFALQGSRSNTSYRGTWSAVSRAPWLDALALWPEGSTWGGGGRFTGDRSLALCSGGLVLHPDHPGRGLSWVRAACPRHASDGSVEDAHWSGRDQRGQTIFTREAKLYRRVGERDVQLADWSELSPDPQVAPAAATRAL